MYMENLPDGMHSVLVSKRGGLYITGFDSRRRACLVLFLPPSGHPLRTVAELPYRDYGRYTPNVLAAHDTGRTDAIYVLLYLHPDNLGLEQMSLYRIDALTGRQDLLAAASSPFWEPTALLPRADGSVVVALSGLGPLLVYSSCDERRCENAREINSTASATPGKGGLAELDGMLCMVVQSTAVYSEGGRLVCELADGSLVPVAPSRRFAKTVRVAPARSSPTANGDDEGESDRYVDGHEGDEDLGFNSSSSNTNTSWPMVNTTDDMYVLTNPTELVRSDATSVLYVVSRESTSEYGYAQGSVHALKRRPAEGGEVCGAAGCWDAPRLVVRSVSNPSAIAVDDSSGTLYVIERNTLRGYSYETFHGDVLAFCASGRYDCTKAQNSGECVCEHGYGGACCDIELAVLGAVLMAMATSSFPLVIALLGVCGLATFMYRLGRQARMDTSPTVAAFQKEAPGEFELRVNDSHMTRAPSAMSVAWDSADIPVAAVGSSRLNLASCLREERSPRAFRGAGSESAETSRGTQRGGEGTQHLPEWLDDLRRPLCASTSSARQLFSAAQLQDTPPPDFGGCAPSPSSPEPSRSTPCLPAGGAPYAQETQLPPGSVASRRSSIFNLAPSGSGTASRMPPGQRRTCSAPHLPTLLISQSSSGDNLMRGMLLSTDTLADDAYSPRIGASEDGSYPIPSTAEDEPHALVADFSSSPPAEELVPEMSEDRPTTPTTDDAYDMASALIGSLGRDAPASEPRSRRGWQS